MNLDLCCYKYFQLLKNCIFINITNSPAVMLDIVFVRLKCITSILHVYFVKNEMQKLDKS